MKRITLLLTLLISIFASTNLSARDLEATLKSKKAPIVVVAHRADWRGAPENSIAGIKRAIDMGVDMVEIDLKMTKDSVLILMHDKTLDRTTTGKGPVTDYTYEQISKMSLKNGAACPTEHPIPTFEEVMELCRGKVWVNVDKGYDYFDSVYKILLKTNSVDHCLIKSSYDYERVARENRALLDKVIYMPIINLTKPNAEKVVDDYIANYAPLAYEIVFKEYNAEAAALIKKVVKSGAKVWLNTMWASLCAGRDDENALYFKDIDSTWGWIVKEGKADMIQTDRPEELIEYLKSIKRH